jgi:VanZ family protein
MARNKMHYLNIRSCIPPLVWLSAMWVVSSIPGQNLPTVKILSIDKVYHIVEYLVLAVLVNRSCKKNGLSRKTIYWIYILLLINAIIDELHQHFIPNRSVSVWDILANMIGLGIGLSFTGKGNDRSKVA